MQKFKQILFFLTILSLPIELAFVKIGGRDIKFWFIFAVLGGVVVLADWWKKGIKEITSLKSFYLGIATIFFSCIALVDSPVKSFSIQQLVILISLITLAMFVEKYSKRCKKKIPSGLAIGMILSSILAIWQNIAFNLGNQSLEIMAARPNALFPEPDWLGFYLSLGLVFFVVSTRNKQLPEFLKNKFSLSIFWLLNITALIITVARASWLAFILEAGVTSLLLATSLYLRKKDLKEALTAFLKKGGAFVALILISIAIIQIFQLTRFNLFDRMRSIFFKQHIVTMAYNPITKESLKINLEEKETYIQKGFEIKDAYVPDENVISREDKAVSAWDIIKKHPILGNGLGIILIETNYQHNANNLFLEWWASAGIGGLMAITGTLVYFIVKGLTFIKNEKRKSILLIAGTLGFIALNLFNASILLAFAWFFLGYLFSLTHVSSRPPSRDPG